MSKIFQSSILCIALCIAPVAQAATLSTSEERSAWVPEAGDHVMVDTEHSIVYLVHQDGRTLTLDGLTGQWRNVYYIGRSYFAETPTGKWVIKAVEEKGPSITFGAGRFLRLYKADSPQSDRDVERTPYGIHSHRSFQLMLEEKREKKGFDEEGKGHRSYGCVLLSEEDLTIVAHTLNMNDGYLVVQTGRGLAPPLYDPMREPSWLGAWRFPIWAWGPLLSA